MDNREASANAAGLGRLLDAQGGPALIREVRANATAADWRGRAAMMLEADVPSQAFDDYVRALAIDTADQAAIAGLAQTAILSGRIDDAIARLDALADAHPGEPAIWVAKSKLLAASGATGDAVDAARQASEMKPLQPIVLEQLGALFNSLADADQLDVVVQKLQDIAPDRASTHYYAAVAKLLRGEFAAAVGFAEQAVAADTTYAAAYDALGAAHLKLGEQGAARSAFETSLRFNAHDSTAYTNLGIIELTAGNRQAAARFFAEALWLDPESATARQGLAQARQ